MKRIRISSGTRWEPIVGYSRVVRTGNHVYVSGTTATDGEGNIVGVGNLHQQTVQVIKNIEKALEKAGARLEDVVRTRIYVVDITQWETVGKVHGVYFEKIRPSTSMVEVSKLIDDRLLVEIEAVAVVDE